MGDPNGIGPEVIARSWQRAELHERARMTVIGCSQSLRRAIDLVGSRDKCQLHQVGQCEIELDQQPVSAELLPAGLPPDWNTVASSPEVMPIVEVGLSTPANSVNTNPAISKLALPSASFAQRPAEEAGVVAAQAIQLATTLAVRKDIDAIVTAPLNKKSLNAAGISVPGHTELLATYCNVPEVAMMLYLPQSPLVASPLGLSIIHATLHCSVQNAVKTLTQSRIEASIQLAHEFGIQRAHSLDIDQKPRVGVGALNPHAGEQGLFGDEERRLIRPAVLTSQSRGIHCIGPEPIDTLIRRATLGEFDGVVAMLHDHGHVAVKLLDMFGAVNITLGLPIVRTSVAHGTAESIAWTGVAESRSMEAAMQLAIDLC